jgi:hypothetical protein
MICPEPGGMSQAPAETTPSLASIAKPTAPLKAQSKASNADRKKCREKRNATPFQRLSLRPRRNDGGRFIARTSAFAQSKLSSGHLWPEGILIS